MIQTRVARHVFGDNFYFGHAVAGDLLGGETFAGLMAMAAKGRRPSDEERVVLDAIAVILTSADPRIWPLKLTRLVASYGGTLAGFGAGQLAMDGKTMKNALDEAGRQTHVMSVVGHESKRSYAPKK